MSVPVEGNAANDASTASSAATTLYNACVAVGNAATKTVKFEGANVITIIMQAGVPSGYVLCRMSDSTTRHVPTSLFK